MSDVEAGVRRTLAALAESDRLSEIDAGRCAVAVALAQMMAHKAATGRGSTFSNDARLLVELLDQLRGDEAAPGGFEERAVAAMAEWEALLKAAESQG